MTRLMFSSEAPWRNHHDIDVAERSKNSVGNSYGGMKALSDNTDNGFISENDDVGELFKFRDDRSPAIRCC